MKALNLFLLTSCLFCFSCTDDSADNPANSAESPSTTPQEAGSSNAADYSTGGNATITPSVDSVGQDTATAAGSH